MSSPQKIPHSHEQGRLVQLTFNYADDTPETQALVNATNILGPDAEPQPDTCLFILPEHGGQTRTDDKGYLTGPPEWIGEISDGTESIDLHRKKLDYEKAGVREYMVVAVRTEQVFRFIRRRGKFKPIAPDSDGIIRSETFPGFWVDVEAFLQDDSKRLHSILREGLSSAEHAAFVAKLAKRK